MLPARCFASLNMTGVGRVGKRLKLDGGALLDGQVVRWSGDPFYLLF